MKQRMKQTIAALSLSLLSLSAQAAIEGVDYTVLSRPIPQQQAGKIEVLEFFGYFCVHCYHLDPVLLQHSKTFAKDVSLRTEHVVWMPEMLGLAKVAAAVNLSGLKYQANPVIFKAVYEQKISQKLLQAYNSPAAAWATAKMQQLTETYRIENTPTVIVGGKYKVNFNGSDWKAGMKTIDELIVKVRREQSSKPL